MSKKAPKSKAGRFSFSIWDERDMLKLAELYSKDLPYNDIANILGRSTNAVRTRVGMLRIAYKLRFNAVKLVPVMTLRTRKKKNK